MSVLSQSVCLLFAICCSLIVAVQAKRQKLECAYRITPKVGGRGRGEGGDGNSKVDIMFFSHVKSFMANHESTTILSGFLKNGRIMMSIRFYIHVKRKKIVLKPDYLMLKARTSDSNPNFLRSQKPQLTVKKFLDILKRSFMNAYFKPKSKFKSNQPFSQLTQDKKVNSYLRKVNAKPFYLYVESVVARKGINIKFLEISSKDQGSKCKLKLPIKRLKDSPKHQEEEEEEESEEERRDNDSANMKDNYNEDDADGDEFNEKHNKEPKNIRKKPVRSEINVTVQMNNTVENIHIIVGKNETETSPDATSSPVFNTTPSPASDTTQSASSDTTSSAESDITPSPASDTTQSISSDATSSPASDTTPSPASGTTQTTSFNATSSLASDTTPSPASGTTQTTSFNATSSLASDTTQSPASDTTQSTSPDATSSATSDIILSPASGTTPSLSGSTLSPLSEVTPSLSSDATATAYTTSQLSEVTPSLPSDATATADTTLPLSDAIPSVATDTTSIPSSETTPSPDPNQSGDMTTEPQTTLSQPETILTQSPDVTLSLSSDVTSPLSDAPPSSSADATL